MHQTRILLGRWVASYPLQHSPSKTHLLQRILSVPSRTNQKIQSYHLQTSHDPLYHGAFLEILENLASLQREAWNNPSLE